MVGPSAMPFARRAAIGAVRPRAASGWIVGGEDHAGRRPPARGSRAHLVWLPKSRVAESVVQHDELRRLRQRACSSSNWRSPPEIIV